MLSPRRPWRRPSRASRADRLVEEDSRLTVEIAAPIADEWRCACRSSRRRRTEQHDVGCRAPSAAIVRDGGYPRRSGVVESHATAATVRGGGRKVSKTRRCMRSRRFARSLVSERGAPRPVVVDHEFPGWVSRLVEFGSTEAADSAALHGQCRSRPRRRPGRRWGRPRRSTPPTSSLAVYVSSSGVGLVFRRSRRGRPPGVSRVRRGLRELSSLTSRACVWCAAAVAPPGVSLGREGDGEADEERAEDGAARTERPSTTAVAGRRRERSPDGVSRSATFASAAGPSPTASVTAGAAHGARVDDERDPRRRNGELTPATAARRVPPDAAAVGAEVVAPFFGRVCRGTAARPSSSL